MTNKNKIPLSTFNTLVKCGFLSSFKVIPAAESDSGKLEFEMKIADKFKPHVLNLKKPTLKSKILKFFKK